MTKQKKGFWTFVFSFIPGAGEMHMGFMKQGISIMTVFWMIIGLAALLDMGPLLFVLPLLWFYSFFNVHNLKSLSEEEFYSIEDDYAFHLDQFVSDKENLLKKYRKVVAIALIVIGFTILWNNSYRIMVVMLPDYLVNVVYQIGNMLPQLVVGISIIAIGVSMIKGKKQELDDNENA